MRVSRILHAGYLFESGDTRIAFDPIFENPFSKNCYAFPEIKFDLDAVKNLKLDAIVISHYHDDHFSLDSLNLLDRKTPIYLFSLFEELFSLITDLGFEHVHPIELFQPIKVGPFEILPLEALDADVDSIYHIKTEDKNILHVVDSWIGPRTMDRLLKTDWDLVLWPFQTMREIEVICPSIAEPITKETVELPPEWLEQLQSLKPKAIVPSSCQFRFESWSWYNSAFFPISYAGFAEQMKRILPQIQNFKLNPGESLELGSTTQRSDRLPWIKPVGDQNLDYEFDPKVKPQSISEIAQNFPALTSDQRNLVHNFCGKLKTDKSWKLLVYDHMGKPFEYVFNSGKDWITEISEAKLYGALTAGESLTSIYIRVTPSKDADPLEDPLIRALYDGIVGGYQKAQASTLLTGIS